MGAISPNPYVTDEVFEEFKKNIMAPTLKGIQNEGMDFEGVIFFWTDDYKERGIPA